EPLPLEHGLLERSFMLGLTAPEMTALVGGMRALDANFGGTAHGVLTERPESLTNDFFVNLLDRGPASGPAGQNLHTRGDRATGEPRWTASAADLVFGSHSQLRALAEVYASDDGEAKLVSDFAAAWSKVMNLDRFEVS